MNTTNEIKSNKICATPSQNLHLKTDKLPQLAIRMKTIKLHKNALRILEPITITAFWLLAFSSPFIFGKSNSNQGWLHILNVWKDFLPFLLLFLLNRFVLLPLLFFRNRRSTYLITVSSIILLMTAGRYFSTNESAQDRTNILNDQGRPLPFMPPPETMDKSFRPQQQRQPGPLPPYINMLVLSILIVGFDTGLKASVKWAQSEQQRIMLEKENAETQLAFLRNQVSPHFFMNTLNNIHALIDIDKEQAKDSIIKLSMLMRHLLYESDGMTTPIKKEVDFVVSYVELMRLRFSQNVNITLDIPEVLPNKTIPPLLFTSLLENAFKHGITYGKASFIHISVLFSENTMVFKVVNSKVEKENKQQSSGIGIINLKKRLDILYNDSQNLDILDGEKEFTVTLNLPI